MDLRSLCLGFTGAEETYPFSPEVTVFKVRGKIFAMRHSLHEQARWSVWLKAAPGLQEALVSTAPERFFRPPYVGHRGWVGAYLDVEQDWEELAELIEESYCMTAPKRLVAQLAE